MLNTKQPKVFIPAQKPEDWKRFLADEKHWRKGYSAYELAYSWQEAQDFPPPVRKVFENSGFPLFGDVELLLALPEYQVPLPPASGRPSQSDIFVLARGNNQLIAITVEGKVSEDFGPTVGDWIAEGTKGKQERLRFLLKELGLEGKQVNGIRYQLLHRTASAILEAERFGARSALMIVHSFSPTSEHFDDYCRFLDLFGVKGEINSLERAKKTGEVDVAFDPGITIPVRFMEYPEKKIDEFDLFFAWVADQKSA